jgi:hypothetical protein
VLDHKEYHKWLRDQSCYGCGGDVDDIHHVETFGMGSKKRKTNDPRHYVALGVCRKCHTKIHAKPRDMEDENVFAGYNLWRWLEETGQSRLFTRIILRAMGVQF